MYCVTFTLKGKTNGAEKLVAADSLPFTFGNPSTELAKGLIHIYKDRYVKFIAE